MLSVCNDEGENHSSPMSLRPALGASRYDWGKEYRGKMREKLEVKLGLDEDWVNF